MFGFSLRCYLVVKDVVKLEVTVTAEGATDRVWCELHSSVMVGGTECHLSWQLHCGPGCEKESN